MTPIVNGPVPVPRGFRFAGVKSGVKLNKADTALIVSDGPCAAAGRVTTNRARAWCADRTDGLLPAAGIRAIIGVSGNANALSGAAGMAADGALARGVAATLEIAPDQVITACTGVIGSPLPVGTVVSSLPATAAALGRDPWPCARALMTTDKVPKIFSAAVVVEGPDGPVEGIVTCIAKGSGMIHPNMATTLGFALTDLPLTPAALDEALGLAIERSWHRITVDGDQSTNDMVVVLSNGAAGGTTIDVGDPRLPRFAAVLEQVMKRCARAVAKDGEGATRLLTIEVSGALDEAEAADVARQIGGSNLVKAAIFGADPGWGRVLSAAGQALAARGAWDATPDTWRLRLQGVEVFLAGEPVPFERPSLAARMADDEVVVMLELGRGEGEARVWGCDLSYDYVKINADYASAVVEDERGSVGLDARLSAFSPNVKRALMIEALRYIERFRGRRIVVKVAGPLLEDPEIADRTAQDIVLLRSVGMHPIIVHGGEAEVTRAIEATGRQSDFVDGHRVTRPEDVDLVEMVLLGKVNRRLVSRINALGGKAVGLSGADAGFLGAAPMDGDLDGALGKMGQVTDVDPTLVSTLVERGYIPVIAPVGLSGTGETWNLDAEDATAALAVAFEAFKLIYLLAWPGIVDKDGQRISQLAPRQAQRLMREGVITGKQVHVVEATLAAIQGGVPKVHLVDGRIAHNLVSELFTDAGVGTLVAMPQTPTV